jgi:hypothetical protein
MQRVATALNGLLKIGSLPSQQDLGLLLSSGCANLVNVAGVSLRDMYGNQTAAAMNLSEFFFSDVFSEPVMPRPDGSEPDYLQIATAEHRQQFSLAVDELLRSISSMTSTYLFCRQGVGRAPSVALTALHTLMGGDIRNACALVTELRPQALITRTTISAAHWYAGRSAR